MSSFGQNNNNQQQNTGFGGFGSNNNNNTGSGFGQPQITGFGGGTSNPGSSIFGTSNNTGFGSTGSGFGSSSNNTSTPFGAARPAFGSTATTSASMFGNNTATAGASTGFGGFGSANANTNPGSLFGGPSKPAFGGGSTSTGGLFGGASSGNTFGSSNNQPSSAFGAPISSALGGGSTECQGTGSTPFQAFSEKETGNNTVNHFQSISFMQPYKNFSFEELRLADYNQGRRYGNGSGQAGAFGANTGFGGFGQQNNTGPFGASSNTGPFGASSNTGGGLFGAQATSTPSPFGSTQTAGSGFGSGTGGGIFGGGAKPAGGLFGAASTTPSQPAGSLFGGQSGFGGSSSGTGTGFGNTSGTAGGGLFGSGSQPTQKPGFSLGGAHTGTGFGTGGTSANNNTGGIFGNNQASSGFGSGQQQAPASNPFGAFGTGQAQNQSSTGSVFSGFGAANQSAQKPGGMFGSTPANSGAVGGGLFGNNQSNNQQQPSGGGLFGSGSNNQPGGSSLFTQKQNSAGTGLFGNSSSSSGNNVGGGLFGGGFNTNNNNQPQQNQGGGLFGNNAQQQQQQPKQGSIFGGNASGTGGGLFGNNNNQQPNGSSLFGNMGSNNQQQSSGLFGTANNNGTSLFGTSQQQQPNALQPPQPQYASALDASISPYGSSSLYSGLPPTPHLNAGPIATPISKGQKLKKGAVLPQYKINPNQASRLVTPQKRGFGFSYSTYGTPSSISSNASTPGGFNSSLLYSSIGRSLGKSLSTSNLRRSFDTEGDSILTPGAFSAGGSRFAGSGSLKKLTIDRSLRTDLFGGQGLTTVSSPEKTDQSRQLGILKKKVSFDASTVGGNGNSQNSTVNNTANGVELREDHNDATPSAQEQGFLRSSSRGNPKLTGPKLNGASSQLEIEQIKGNELAIVHEDEPPENTAMFAHKSTPPIPQIDPQPGEYWMKPSIEELSKLSKDQLRSVSGFSVGRRRCGHVEFNEPVDLTLNPLEAIFKKFALIEVRSLTVYPDSNLKPSRGQGMNVPSTIFLQNSWPRQLDRKTPLHEKSGPRFNKHVDRLRKVTGTEFVRYEKDTGIWVFKVPHFTTYALDFDDTGSEGDSLHTSIMSEMPDTPTPKTRATRDTQTPNPSTTEPDSSILSDEPSLTSSSPDDTFEFRKKKTLPGAFDNASSLSEVGHQMEEINYDDDSFLDQRLAVSPSPSPSQSEEDEPSELEAEGGDTEHRPLVVQDDQVEMAGSFPDGDHEHMQSKNGPGLQIRSILKKTDWKFDDYGTPTKLKFNPSGDWADELQRTISPRKQDRQALRLNQSQMPEEPILDREITPKATLKLKDVDQPLVTSIDLMNSLFGKEQARRSGRGIRKGGKGKGFEWPYNKKSKTDDNDEDNMTEVDRVFHQSFKPSWGPESTLLYAMPTKIDLSKSKSAQNEPQFLDQKGCFISEGKDVRLAKFAVQHPLVLTPLVLQRAHTDIITDDGVPYANAQNIPFQEIASGVRHTIDHETHVWELASILFDELDSDITGSDSFPDNMAFEQRIRKERLIQLWEKLCHSPAMKDITATSSAEERAVAHLSAHNVVEACDELIRGKDFRLSILVAQIGGDSVMHEDMANQIKEWRNLNVLSEMTEPIRTLYELLSGNTCLCEGKKGPLEDRARSFLISQRFKLDWKRTFGLRLWYAILTEDPIETAVEKYAEDLNTHETKKPLPQFFENQTNGLWTDKGSALREDVLWGLLKLYSSSKGSLPEPSITDIVMPHNMTGNPLDARLSFQLYHALSARFPTADASRADQLAWDFAVQLDAGGEWLWAIFVLLHLTDRNKRQQGIQAILAQRTADIANAQTSEFRALTDEFKIPASWIWEAKALHARSVAQDHVREMECLLLAKNWEEAHKTLCRIVGPQAVIKQDYATLKRLMDAFEEGKVHIGEWTLGGQVYGDFIDLIQGTSKAHQKVGVLKRLLSALPVMVQERVGTSTLDETVAIKEMSAVVGKEVAKAGGEKGIETWRVLQLPLASDAYLAHTLEMGLQYYKAVMADGL